MKLFRSIWLKVRSLLHRREVKWEIDEELRFHIEQRTAENVAAGMKPEDAAREARKRFGNVQGIREECRDRSGASFGETVWQDVRFALRQLRKSPGFTAVAVLSLALGIGAGTAVFSLVNGILLRSLPVLNPQELRVLHWAGKDLRIPSWNGGDTSYPIPMFARLREQAVSQAEVFGFVPLNDVIARARNEAFPAQGAMVSDNFLSGLGVRPLLGRDLMPGEDYAGTGTCVLISYDWWEKHYGLDPAVLGETLTLNGTAFTIVGVLPRGFTRAQLGEPAAFFVPMSANSQFLYPATRPNFHWYVRVMARLKPGANDGMLQAALNVAFASEAADFMKEPRISVEPGGGGLTYARGSYRKPLLLMLAVVGLVMLVACANLACLSLARGAARQHELAVRSALGAGRWRLMRQSLTESVVLALIGGGLGILVAIWGRTGIARLLIGSGGDLHYDFPLDATVLGFTLAAALVTALLSGMLPALRAGRVDPVDGLKSRRTLGAPRLRLGRVLVATQIGLSLLLLAGAGLYARTLVNLARIDAGFSTEKLVLFRLNLRGAGYANSHPAEFFADLQDKLAAVPGVRAVSLVEFPLLSGAGSSGTFASFSGRPAADGANMSTSRLTVGETFFSTLSVPILQGRGFSAADAGDAPKVIVVNEAFVRKYLPDENPLGLTVPVWDANWQIVGVCRDIKYASVKEPAPPTAYFPFRQRFYSRFRQSHLRTPYFAVRTALPPMSLANVIRKTVAAGDPAVAVTEWTTQEAVRNRSISQEQLLAVLCGALAGLAVLLSCIGLHGLMAYNVARRTNEIGIRMALGATRASMAWPILREAVLLTGIGVAVGVPLALGLTRFVKSQLYGVAPTDSATLIGASVLLMAVAALSAWLPARRAARVNPMEALRCE